MRFALLACSLLGNCAFATVSITPATNGANIPADKAANAASPQWTALGPIVISEGIKMDIGSAGGTLVLKAPAGFEFDTSAPPNITFVAGGDITSATLAITNSTTIVITLTLSGTGTTDQFTVGNVNPLRVRPTLGTPLSSGQIFRPSAGGGSLSANGITGSANANGSGGSNFGTLSEAVGSAASLAFTTQPGAARTGAIFGTQPVVKTQDQFGNNSASGLASSVPVSVALTSGTGPLLGATSLNIGSSGGNGTVSYTNLEIDVGGTNKQLTASASGLTNAVSSLFTVNSPPTISSIPDITTNEDLAITNFFTVTDLETPADSLIFTATSSNTSLITVANIVFGGSGINRSATLTPTATVSGTSTITISASDGSLSSSNSFLFTVNSVNDPPTLTALTNRTILEDAGIQTVNLAGISPGPSNESAQTVTITSTSGNPSLIPNPTVNYTNPNATGTLTFTPLANQFGTATITVVLKDNGGTANGGVDSLTNSFTVTVSSVNDPPTLGPISDVSLNPNPGLQTINLTGISEGPANESTQTLTVTASSSNTNVIPNPTVNYTDPNSTGTLTFVPVTNANGSSTITVTVKDNGGTSNGGQDTITRQFNVTVSPLADVRISQAAIPSPAFLGGTINFKLTVTNTGPTTATGIQVTNTFPAGIGSVSVTPSQGTSTIFGGTAVCSIGTLTNGGFATVNVVVEPLTVGSYTNVASVGSGVADPNLANNVSSATDSVGPPQFAITATAVTSESCINGFIDPAERITMNISLKNNGTSNTTNLVATLKVAGGVTAPTGPQNYGALTAGGAAVTRSFSFNPVGDCGGPFTITLQLQDGAASLGAASKTLVFGQFVSRVTSFSSADFISIPSSGPADPYPSSIVVSGLNTNILKLTVTLSQLDHTQPDDLDILLVGPNGQQALLMSDCGGINVISGVDLTFDSTAATGLPDSGLIVSGTFKPTDFQPGDVLDPPAPAGPYLADLTQFNGTDPNGTWRLYVLDDTPGFAGDISGGWTLNVTTVEPSCCVDNGSIDIALAMSAAPDPVVVGNNITFTITATNNGPASATGVIVTNPLPANTIFVSANSSQGTATNNGTAVVCALGTLNNVALATINVTLQTTQPGILTNTATITANEPDRALVNNTASATPTVSVPQVDISDAFVVEGNGGTTTNAVFTLQLSAPSSQTITVGVVTADLTALAGSDYVATNGTVVFNPGQTTRTFAVTVLGDNLSEATEFFAVGLTNPVNVTIGVSPGTGSISDDDPLPAITISDASVVEGNSGTTNMQFIVTLSPSSGQGVSFNFATANGSALAGSDYVASSGTVSMNPGQTTAVVPIPIIGETINESNETFVVNLSGVVNATLSRTQAVGTIINDDFMPLVGSAGAVLAGESCAPTNGVIDPNETVTVNFALRNISAGNASTTNLVATLLQSGGITAPGAPQNYGALTAGGASVSRPFTFTANGSCGDTLMAVLQLQDGASNLGTVTNFLTTGKTGITNNSFTVSTAITIPSFGAATPYPSTIPVSGLGAVSKVTATLFNLSHTYPSDVQALLVGPGGQTVVLMSDAGSGLAITNVTLTLDDSASSFLPATNLITSGTYKPTDYLPASDLPSPAPASPYGASLSVFNGTDSTGDWSLYLADDSVGDAGSVAGGWRLTLTTLPPAICCGGDSLADLSVGVAPSVPSIGIGSNFTYTVNVTNLGPNTASDVLFADTLPTNVSFVSATSSLGSPTNINGVITCSLGTMSIGAQANLSIVVTTLSAGYATNIALVTARTADPNPANSSVTTLTPVAGPAPVASFTASPTAGTRPLNVTFNDTSLGTITNRSWIFGNGTTTNTSATNFVFNYPVAGTNTVSLTVIGPNGTNVLTRNNYIVVTNPPPLLVLSPTNLDFGALVVGQSSTQNIQVVNSGGLTLTGTVSATLPFSIRGGSPLNLPAGQTGLVAVSFSPSAVGNFTNSVIFLSNGGNSTNRVTGSGFIPAQMAVSPPTLSFGTVAVGSNAQANFTATNSGSIAISNGAVSVGAGAFSIISNPSFQIPGFSSTNLTVRFTPGSAGAFSNAVIFTSEAGNSSNPVTGTGAIVPVAAFSGSPTTGLHPLTVTFTDNSTGTITNRFWNFGDGATTNTAATSFTHLYATAGTNTVSLTVSGPVGTNTLSFSNYIQSTNLPPQLALIPTNIAFSQLIAGQSSTQSFQVRNLGDLTLTGTASTTLPFAIQSGSPYSVAAGQTGTVTVVFSPANGGSFSNTVNFISNGGNSTNPVTGSAITPGQLSVLPASLNFGTVAVGASPQASFTLTNLGQAALTNGTVTVNAGPFAIISGTPFTLGGAGTTNVVISFTPAAALNYSNAVIFTANNSGKTNPVTGTGAIIPVASFTGTPTNGVRPLTVTFTDSSTGTITNRFWDFGDGQTTNTAAVNFTHTYASAGTNTVSLTVTGPVGTNALSRPGYIVATNPPPQLAVSPAGLNLGPAVIGQTNTQNFQIINTGGLTLTGSVSASLPFVIQSGGVYNVPPGQTSSVAVAFSPLAAGSFSNAVVFISNGGNSTNTVTGTGLTPAQLAVLPFSLDLGAVIVGSNVQGSFVATNQGGGTLSNVTVSVGGGPFTLVSSAAFDLVGFGSTNIVMRFTPPSEGSFSDVVVVATNGGGTSTNTITGVGAIVPAASFNGNPTTGFPPLIATFTDNSTGTITNRFWDFGDGLTTNTTATNFTHTYAAAGTNTVRLTVSGPVGTNLLSRSNYIVVTNLPPQLTLNPTNLAFGQLIAGQTSTQSFQVINSGQLTLTGNVATTLPFAIQSGSPYSVAPGQTGVVSVTFSPAGGGSFSNTAVFISNGGNSTNAITGSALTPGQLSILPASLDFGTVAVGASPQASFTLTNLGQASMTNGTVAVSAGPFAIVSGTQFSLPGSGSTNVVVSFTPNSAATFSNAVVFTANNSSTTNAVTGIGAIIPVAAFSGSPTNGVLPLAVSFTDSSTGTITNRFWDFGDGQATNTAAVNFTHIYASAGTNTVNLTVTGPVGTNSLSRTGYIVVTNSPPQLVVTPTNLDLGTLVVGQTNSMSFQIVNAGGLPLTGSAATTDPFSVPSGSPFTLAPGETGAVVIAFVPTNSGFYSNAVLFASNGGNPTNWVTGTSLPPGQLSVSPAILDLGAVVVGGSVQASFVATNLGGDVLTNVSVSIVDGPFALVSPGSFALPGFAATNVVVSFSPTNEGISTRLIFFAASSGSDRTNRVVGRGALVPVAEFSANPTSGPPPLTVTFTDSSTGTVSSRFWDFGDGTTTNTTSANVLHTYANAGTNDVSLTVSGPVGTNSLLQPALIVVTNLPPQLTVNPTNLAFSPTVIGQTSTQSFQVINIGGLTLTGSVSVSLPFAIPTSNSFSVAPGQTGSVSVAFSPSAAGSVSNVVVFLSNGGSSTNAVTGIGLTPAQLAVVPGSLNFGTVPVGTNAQASFVLTNTGGAVLSNGIASLSAPPFSLVSGTPFALPGFGSTNLVVSFAPSSAANFNNAVVITSDGGNSTNTVIGTGAIIPVANFTGSPTIGLKPLTVTFTDSSTGTITNRLWNFGDGLTTNTVATSLTHVYTNAGTNSVSLTVSGPVGTNAFSRANYITITNLPPNLIVTPSALSFGQVVIGQTNTQTFQITNSGGVTLTGTVSATLPFRIQSGTPYTVAPGQAASVSVSFAPVSAATFSNTVIFISNGGNSTNSVTGIGLTPAHLAVSPASLAFGTVAVGSNAQASLVLTNSGGATLSNGTASVTGGPFTIVSGSPFTLPGFGSTNLVVRFTPVSAVNSSNAVILTTSNGGNSTNALTGTGAVVPVANFSASPTNGLKPLTVNLTDTSTGTITNRFWDFGDGATTNTGLASFTHVYANAGTNTVVLTVTGPVGTNTLVRNNYILVTNLPPQLVVNPSNLSFGQLTIGQTSTQSFQIVNSGGQPLNGSAVTASPFAIPGGGAYSLGAGQTGSVSVTFTPGSAGSFSNVVSFTGNGGNSVNPVTGSAITPGQLAALPAILDFGIVDLDAGTNAQASLVITNLGGAPITNGLASIGGGPFAILAGASFSLAGFDSTNITLSFNPASEGSFNNVVVLTSSGGNSTNVLTGAAAAEPQANFTADPTNGLNPLTVTFTDTSLGTVTNRTWFFGDGTLSNTPALSVSHTYTNSGTYSVSLNASGPVGNSSALLFNLVVVTNPPPLLSVSPASLNFGQVVIGATNTQNFQLVNNGGSTLTGTVSSSVTFRLSTNSYNLAPGQTGLVSVSFSPPIAVNFSNVVVFLGNGGSSTSSVFGTGLTPPQLGVSPSSIDFGTVAVGSNAQASFVLTNRGGAPLTNGTITSGGPFTILSGTPFSLPGFGSTNLILRFTPSGAVNYSNVVIITSAGGNSTNTTTGTGAVVPAANFTGSPTIGLKPLTVTFTDSSIGTITDRFWDFGDGLTTNTSSTTLTHVYTSAATNTVSLTVTGPVGSNTLSLPNYIAVTNPPPNLIVTPFILNFGQVVIGQSNSLSFQITNSGGVLLTGAVTATLPYRVQSGSPYTLAPGQAAAVTIGFTPSSAGVFNSSAVFVSNGGNRTNLVVGTGLTPAQLSVTPPSLNFGAVSVGSTAQAAFVLTNLGGAAITSGTASVNDGGFTILSGTPFSLPGFGSTNVVVRFSPTDALSFSNVVVFTTANDGSSTNSVVGAGAFTPVANFTGSPISGVQPLLVSFTDTSTGTIVNRFWDFGDGTTTNTTATSITHAYTAGTNDVSLTVSGPVGTNQLTRAAYIAAANLPPQIVVSPTNLDFGVLTAGQNSIRSLQIVNTGGLPLTGSVTATAPFGILDGSSYNLGPGQTGLVSVIFAPAIAGNFSNELVFLSNGGNSTNSVIGVALTPAQLAVSPPILDLGTAAVGSSIQASLILTNLGGAALLNGSASVSGGAFSIVSGTPFSLPGFGTTNLVIQFTPGNAVSYSDVAVITSDGGNSTNQLAGVGAFVPGANFAGNPTQGLKPLTVNFADNSTGTITSRLWDFGDGSTTNTSATSFTHVYANAGAYSVGLTVAGPVGINTFSRVNYVTVTNLPPNLIVNPNSLNFGQVVIGQTTAQTFQITNSGGLTLSGTVSATPPFAIQNGTPYNIAPGQSALVTINFSPVTAGNFNNSVVFLSNGGNSTNSVTGIGLTPGHLSVSPAGLTFGTVAVGANAQASLVLTNTGGAPITNGTAVTAAPFSILSGTPFSLPGFGSTNLVVRFTPAGAVSYSNVVTLSSDGGNSTNSVTGTGAIVPSANFTGNPTRGLKPLTVTFTDTSTGTITNRFWNFGDGLTTNTTGTSLTHVYANAGTNTVSLTATGPVGTNTLSRAGYIAITNLPPNLIATPAALDFGQVVIGQTGTQSFQITNSGGLTLIGTVSATLPFIVQSGGSYSLSPGQAAAVTIGFPPASAATYGGIAVFISNGGNRTNTMTGIGLTPPQLSISPPTLSFGAVAVGSSVLGVFTLTNLGGGAISAGGASLNDASFTIVSGTPFSLPGFGSTNLVVRFAPTAELSYSNAIVFTTSNDGGSTNAVTGSGATAPVASFSANPTTGLKPLLVTFTDNSTGTIANRFWDFGDGSTTNTSGTSVAHVYANAGTNTVSLTVAGPLGTNALSRGGYIAVTNLPPKLIVTPDALAFGLATLGQTIIQSFQITNSGGVTLMGSATASAPFAIQSGIPYSVAPGQSALITVSFVPVAAGNFNDAVVFTSNGGNSTNSVNGIGLTPGQLSVSPASFDFGTVAVGSSAQASFVVTNLGGAPITNGGATISGPFGILSGTPFSLSGFDSTNLVVQFTPAFEASYNSLVVITSDGGNTTNAVTGIGALMPAASFVGTPTTGLVPMTVTFTDNSTGTITNRFWSFGDGSTTNTSATTLTHTYTNAGSPTVSLIVTGPVGSHGINRPNYVSVTNLPPNLIVAPATLSFAQTGIGQTNAQTFQITNSGGATLTGNAVASAPFAIQSGNPYSVAPGQSALIAVAFSPVASGTFSNSVVFTSNGGNSTNSVTGTGADVLASSFVGSPTTGSKPLTVTFTDDSTGVITRRFWNFGDGSTTNSPATNFTHTFSNAGTYTVSLLVSGPAGTKGLNRPNYIFVTEPLSITAIQSSGSDVFISFTAAAGKSYRLEYTDTLTPPNWLTAVDSLPGIDGTVTAVDSGGAAKPLRLYRIRQLP